MVFFRREKEIIFCLLSIFFMSVFSLPVRAEEKQVVRVGYPIQDGFTMKDEDGSYSGYTYDYLEELAQYTGWEYEFVEAEGDLNESFSTLLAMLEDGKIDILGGIFYDEALTERFSYAGSSYGSSYLSLVVLDSNTAFTSSSYADRGPLKTAVAGKGSHREKLEEYAEGIGLELELIECASETEQEELLRKRQVDAILRMDVAIPDGCRAVARFSIVPFYLTLTKGNYELTRQLNAGMLSLLDAEPNLCTRLHQSYLKKASSHIIYNDAEQRLMDTAAVLKVAVLDGKAPIQSIDSKTGEAAGIARGVFDYISEETGLKFEYVCTSDAEEYRELLADNQVDLAIAVPFDSRVARQFHMMNTLPYLTTSQILVFRRGMDPNQLEGKTFALYDVYGTPDEEAGAVLRCTSAEEAMEAVDQGRADYCYINSLSFQYCMNQRRFLNVSVVVRAGGEDQSIAIGIPDPGQVTLNGLLNKVIAYLPQSVMQTIQYNNSISQNGFAFRDYMRDNPYQVIGGTGLILLFILGGVLVHFRSKYRMTQKMALENERYRQLAEVVGECVYEYDYQADHLSFFQAGAKSLGFAEDVRAFSESTQERSRNSGVGLEQSLYQWILEKKDGTKDVHVINSEDPLRWYRVTSKVICDARGMPVYAIGRIWDVQEEMDEKRYLMERAQRDGLTGLYNAATIRELISRELPAAEEGGAFYIMDVDLFKEINDQYGHSVGDRVLIRIAECLRTVFEKAGLCGRLGGDEFVAFIPSCKNVREAEPWAAAFRTELERVEILKGGIRVTVSMGVALRGREGSFTELYQKADELLYEVKREGRNGVRCG